MPELGDPSSTAPTVAPLATRRVSFAAADGGAGAVSPKNHGDEGRGGARKHAYDREGGEEDLDVTSVTTRTDDDYENITELAGKEGDRPFSPLKSGEAVRLGSKNVVMASSPATRSATTATTTASSTSTSSWDERVAAAEASDLSWEFTIDAAASTLRHSKTTGSTTTSPTSGQRRLSSFSQSKRRASDLTIDKLQFQRLDTLYGRTQERKALMDAWDSFKAQAEAHRNPSLDVADSVLAAPAPPRARNVHVAGAAGGGDGPIRRRMVVTVRGASGTGKTRLVEVLRWPVLRGGGFFLAGKFPQRVRSSKSHHSNRTSAGANEPYAAFVSACHSLLDVAMSLDDDEGRDGDATSSSPDGKRKSWTDRSTASSRRHSHHPNFTVSSFRDRLRQDMDPLSIKVLIRVVPVLAQVLGDNSETDDSDDEVLDFRQVQQQLRFAFRKFFQTVGEFGPVVLAMDDLQWADAASMELLESLATDRENARLMIVASFRDEDVYSKCPHVLSMENLRAAAELDATMRVISVQVGELQVEQVNELLVDLLSSDPAATEGLAEIVHKKTHGNVFFVIQFLTVLQESQLLVFNFGAMKWLFDEEEIRLSTAATENVVSLIKKKMARLSESIRFVLPIMACLGSTFPEPLLALVLDRVNRPNEVELERPTAAFEEVSGRNPGEAARLLTVADLLAACIDEGLIEPGVLDRGVETYQWVHDKIQETAFSLLSDGDIQALKLRMGRALFERLDENELDRYIFTVVDLLNDDSTSPQALTEGGAIAKLYLRAGVKTIENSAFDQAGGYLARGISLLPPGHWATNYDVSLELYSVAAQADFCSGNFERMRNYCDEVIRQDVIPLIDKRRVYNAMIDAKCGECTELALNLCKEILEMVGIRFPRVGVLFHVVRGVVGIKAMMKKTTDLPSLIASVPKMEDDMQMWIMVLLDKFATYAYLSKSPLLPLAIFRGFRMTLSDGVSFISPVMFSLVGLTLAGFVQDYKGGVSFAEEALDMLKRVNGTRKVEVRVMMVAHGFVLHWQRPIQMSLKPLLVAYEGGMAVGDTESASWSVMMYIEFSLRSGGVLDDLLADCSFYGEQMKDVKQLNSLDTLRQMWQALLHISGSNAFNGALSGDVANPDITQRHEQFFATHYRWLMYVAFVLGDYQLVYDTIMKTKQHKGFYEEILPGTLGIGHLYAFNGLALISLYRETTMRTHLRLARKFATKIKGYTLAGNPNFVHFDNLLEAELLSLRGKSEEASKQYEAAILYCGRRGILQDRALAHERYGEHFARLGADFDQDADYHIREAIKLYLDWGAHAKVQRMRKVHPSKFAGPRDAHDQ